MLLAKVNLSLNNTNTHSHVNQVQKWKRFPSEKTLLNFYCSVVASVHLHLSLHAISPLRPSPNNVCRAWCFDVMSDFVNWQADITPCVVRLALRCNQQNHFGCVLHTCNKAACACICACMQFLLFSIFIVCLKETNGDVSKGCRGRRTLQEGDGEVWS